MQLEVKFLKREKARAEKYVKLYQLAVQKIDEMINRATKMPGKSRRNQGGKRSSKSRDKA